MQTLADVIRRQSANLATIRAPDRGPMAGTTLATLTARVAGALRASGISQSDVVAIVMPNGPEMAVAFLAVAAAAVTAPLNPAYRTSEFEFYFDDLKAKALIVASGLDSAARATAQARGIRVIDLTPDLDGPAGSFTLSVSGEETGLPAPSPSDVALVLHTSGTTSKPKQVPLTHANLVASAANIAQTLSLTETDRSLVIMPLFHIHGLVGALLSSMWAGAGVFCTTGFNALKMFGWLEESRATWYSAVPTMHQAILGRSERNRESIRETRLRFIRSSSASLPPQVMVALETTFGCPVIEAYGMTEAAHQMASNPLPPRVRKPGSVGLAAGPEVTVMASDGTHAAPDAEGELIIRGPNVTAGYISNPKANAEAFADGWFRTGDLGIMDEDGYVFIKGRLKEIINRGGEKIAPNEVDVVLLDHPAVAQVVTFGLRHEKLGEEVAAAVVLREGMTATEKDLREHTSARLADFKVPRRIVFLEEIPKGPTGKLQRIGMAARLGLEP